MSTPAGKASAPGRSGLEFFLAGWGLCALFFQLPITKMVLDDPQSLYLGAWNNATFFRFLFTAFLLAPLGIGGLSWGLFKLHRTLGFAVLTAAASFFLAMGINAHYLQLHFLEASWRREATLALLVLPLLPLWLIRHTLIRILKMGTLLSLAVGASFIWQAAPLRIAAAAESTPVLTNRQIPHPVFIFTFEKLVGAYFAEADGTFLSDRFPNLAGFLKTADYYPNAYANSTATVYALKSIYAGRFLTSERDWTRYPNLRDILGAHNRVYMFLDILTRYCRLNRDIGIRTLGDVGTLGEDLLKGWYKTYWASVLPDPVEDRLPGWGLNWSFNPVFDLWHRESRLHVKQNPKEKITFQLGRRQFDELEAILEQQLDRPNIYLVHNFISDSPGTKSSQLLGRSEADRLTDLETARKNLANFDRRLGRFFNTLKRLGIYDSSLILITSDTGYDPQATHVTGEPNIPFSDEMLRVFFGLKRPGQNRPRRITSVIRQIDVLPTLLSALDMDPTPYRFEGVPVTDPEMKTDFQQRPLDFSITSSLGGILRYQLTSAQTGLHLTQRQKQDIEAMP